MATNTLLFTEVIPISFPDRGDDDDTSGNYSYKSSKYFSYSKSKEGASVCHLAGCIL